ERIVHREGVVTVRVDLRIGSTRRFILDRKVTPLSEAEAAIGGFDHRLKRSSAQTLAAEHILRHERRRDRHRKGGCGRSRRRRGLRASGGCGDRQSAEQECSYFLIHVWCFGKFRVGG